MASLSPSSQLSWTKEELTSLENQLLEEEAGGGGGGGGGEWQKVAMFFALRLAMAPSVEDMIQLDRQLFLIEQGNAMTPSIIIINLVLILPPPPRPCQGSALSSF